MRAVVLVVALAGCGAPPASSAPANTTAKTPPNPLVRTDLHCTMSAPGDEDACRARGPAYSLQAPLHCYGTNPGPAVMEEERKAYEASSEPCACISPKEIDDCSKVP